MRPTKGRRYHEPVTGSYESSGRTRQKQRTRELLVSTARRLLADGVTPTVEQVADDLSQAPRAFDLNGYVGILYFVTTAVSLYVD